MKILVINGPNLNFLGVREPNLYGKETYRGLVKKIRKKAKELDVKVRCIQSNDEGKLIGAVQRAYRKQDGIVINAGGYTHTSIALLDALKAVALPTVEVHITDISKREDFRKVSYVGMYAFRSVVGEGTDGYLHALEMLTEKIKSGV